MRAETRAAGLDDTAVLWISFVLDAASAIVHAELVPETGQEPDYDAARAALR